MNRRAQIRMSEDEVRAFLQRQRTLQVATNDHDGYPHLVAMHYLVVDGKLAFWTYAKSQKAVNLRRDERITCLVESGETYAELRGVQVKGRVRLIDDTEQVRSFGEALLAHYNGGVLDEVSRQRVATQAPKRVLVIVEPVNVISWDHAKLGGIY